MMIKHVKSTIISVVILMVSTSVFAQKDGRDRKAFNIHDYSWMEGHWKGTAFGGETDTF